MKRGRIIYIGPFVMPDGNATAHRVLQNAKIFEKVGYPSIFIELRNGNNDSYTDKRTYFGFDVWKVPYNDKKKRLIIEYSYILNCISQYSDAVAIVGYNLPSTVTLMLKKICSRLKLKYIVDSTEWYSSIHLSLYKRPFFAFDTFITMKILNKRSDGIIVISTYLKNYYKNNKKVVFLPPMVDKSENIWKDQHSHDNTDVNFVFSGTLRAGKDNLKLCVDCIQSIDTSILDIYGVTKTEYLNHYNLNELDVDDRKIKFHGVVSHVDSIHALKNADYLLLIRENSRKNNAGFSTKLVESISCGTPIISTNTSDVASLIERYACGYIVSFDYKQLYEEIKIISQKERYRLSKECSNVFDFNNYIGEVRNFLDTI